MYRQYISQTSGHTFLKRFQNCLEAMDCEVAKLETITMNFDHTLPKQQQKQQLNASRTYFHEQFMFFNNVDFVLNETEKLHQKIYQEIPMLLDLGHQLEMRLLALREKMLRFEENPKVLATGYQPYRPNDDEAGQTNGQDEEEEILEDSSDNSSEFNSNQPPDELRVKQFNLAAELGQKLSIDDNSDQVDADGQNEQESKSTNSRCSLINFAQTIKQDQILKSAKKANFHKKIEDLSEDHKRAFQIFDRWLKTDDQQQPEGNNGTKLQQNNHLKTDEDNKFTPRRNLRSSQNNNTNRSNKKIPKGSQLKPPQSATISDTPRALPGLRKKMPKEPNIISSIKSTRTPKTPKNLEQFDEFETVEFTPGMTTRIKRKSAIKED